MLAKADIVILGLHNQKPELKTYVPFCAVGCIFLCLRETKTASGCIQDPSGTGGEMHGLGQLVIFRGRSLRRVCTCVIGLRES